MKKLQFTLSFALIPVLFIACGGSSDDNGDGTAGKPATAGTSAGGSASAGTSSSSSGTGTTTTAGTSSSGGNASAGNASGGNASAGRTGAGGANSADCPATQPEDDAGCTLPSGAGGGQQGGQQLVCTYGTERCSCRVRDFGGGNEGGDDGAPMPTWGCRTVNGQGGFGQGGFTFGGFNQGGFNQGGFNQGGSAQSGSGGSGGG
jgi:hypothetical protein